MCGAPDSKHIRHFKMMTAEDETKHKPFSEQSPLWLHGPPAQEASPELTSLLIILPPSFPQCHCPLSLSLASSLCFHFVPLFISLLPVALSCMDVTHPKKSSPETAPVVGIFFSTLSNFLTSLYPCSFCPFSFGKTKEGGVIWSLSRCSGLGK